MQRINRYAALAVAASLFIGVAPHAQAQTVELVTKVEREIEVLEKGVKVRKTGPPEKIVPGDEVIYTVTYTNKTGKPAENVSVTNPVPTHTRYRDGSAAGEGATITYSVDGGKTFATPDKLTVAIKDKSGKDIARPAAAADYTHIRWLLKQSVAPGQSGTVRFRAVVL
jgi:uncharacterized repeat protein (TIGR01451 family)